MDDTEDDARYPPTSSYFLNPSFGSSLRQKLPVRNPSGFPPLSNHYVDEDEEQEDAEDEEEEQEFVNRVSNNFDVDEEDDDDEEEEEENRLKRVNHDDEEDEDDEEEEEERGYRKFKKHHRKKRRLDNLALGYEFAPRVKVPQPSPPAPTQKSTFGGARNSPADWSEQSTFVLLDAWGDRFLQLGRKSLRSDEWHEVAKKVSQASKTLRTDTQCRNRLDTLKKKYKKEKIRMAETGSSSSKWVYFKKMDMLMTAPPRQSGLSCGLDSGEYVFMNPRAYLNRSNGMDEMRDSPTNSELSDGDEEDGSEGLPPLPTEKMKSGETSVSSFKMLAESVRKFGEIYEKIESTKRQQMMELERMRMKFHRDLEVQKRQILERAQAEIAKIRQGDDEEMDVSMENFSG
ncbi:trihelix transcription factor ENAP1-like [Aristolochia californica]|uniref:trihelix transcription factor ENAP1-like n=1 Tax=Aristolochia californica TaxID=171875 RepID=UPI0035E36B43